MRLQWLCRGRLCVLEKMFGAKTRSSSAEIWVGSEAENVVNCLVFASPEFFDRTELQ
jgi:hypothetical protein